MAHILLVRNIVYSCQSIVYVCSIIIFFFSVNTGTHVLVELQNAQTFTARNYLSVWIAIERA